MDKVKKVPKIVKQQYGMPSRLSLDEIAELERATEGQKPVNLDKLIADSKAKANS